MRVLHNRSDVKPMSISHNMPEPGAYVGRAMGIATYQAPEAVLRLTSMGCRYFEMIIGAPTHFDAMSAPQVRLMKRIMDLSGAVLSSVHSDFSAPAQIDQPDRYAREAALLTQRCGIMFAADMGARFYILHPSNYKEGPELEMRIDIAGDSYASLCQFAATQGMVIALENMIDSIGHHENQLLQIVDRADEASGVCFDTGHANLNARLPEMAMALLGRTVTTHMHDNDGQQDRHWFPGAGAVDWAAFGKAYRDTGSKAVLLVESQQIVHDTWQAAQSEILQMMGMPAATA